MKTKLNNEQEAFLDQLEAKGRELKSELQKLRSRGEIAKIDAREGARKILDDCESSLKDWQERMLRAREAAHDSWEELSRGLASGWKELESGVEQARDEIGKAGDA